MRSWNSHQILHLAKNLNVLAQGKIGNKRSKKIEYNSFYF